jgi:hypothetical protein
LLHSQLPVPRSWPCLFFGFGHAKSLWTTLPVQNGAFVAVLPLIIRACRWLGISEDARRKENETHALFGAAVGDSHSSWLLQQG